MKLRAFCFFTLFILTGCVSNQPVSEAPENPLTARLLELKELHDNKLIGDEEYNKSRQRALDEL
jgi:hypothetical protein